MIRTFSLAAVAAAMIAAPAIAAPSVGTDDAAFTAFEKICWAGAGDYLATVNAANGDGWRESNVISDTPAAVSITDKAAREKAVGGATLTLLVTRGLQHTKNGDYGLVTCKLSIDRQDKEIMSESKAWMGGVTADNTPPDPTFTMYYVTNGSAAPTYVGASGAMTAMNTTGAFGRLKFQQDPDAATFVYEVLSKPKS